MDETTTTTLASLLTGGGLIGVLVLLGLLVFGWRFLFNGD